MIIFEFNDCNVCTNPEIVYKTETYKLAWNYLELKIATDGNKWDFGYSYAGGSSPCMPIHGKFNSKKECIESGLDFLWASCTTTINESMNNNISLIPAKQFLEFYENRNKTEGQLSLF